MCALDYDVEEHELLHDCRLLPHIHTLMGSGQPSLRHTALALFKLLLRRCLGTSCQKKVACFMLW